MDCPKCVGKLQPLNIRMYEIPRATTEWRGGPKFGFQSTKAFYDLKKNQKLSLDKCFICTGVWFDKGELRKLGRTIEKRETIGSCLNDPKLYKKLNKKGGLCPRCKVPMRHMAGKQRLPRLHDVLVDVCPRCSGTWLDGGEVNYALKGHGRQQFQNLWRYLWSNPFVRE